MPLDKKKEKEKGISYFLITIYLLIASVTAKKRKMIRKVK